MTEPGSNKPQAGAEKSGRARLVAALAGIAALIGSIFFLGKRTEADEGAHRHGPAEDGGLRHTVANGGTPPAAAGEVRKAGPGYEPQDMRTRQVIIFLILLTAGVTAVVVGVTIFEAWMIGGIGPLVPVVADPPRVTPPPQPRLETANGEMLEVQRAREAEILNNFTWIDEAAGTLSIPIERAIELTVERGLPVRPGEGEQQLPGTTLPQGSSSGRTLERIP